jgi:hypothetical protein
MARGAFRTPALTGKNPIRRNNMGVSRTIPKADFEAITKDNFEAITKDNCEAITKANFEAITKDNCKAIDTKVRKSLIDDLVN